MTSLCMIHKSAFRNLFIRVLFLVYTCVGMLLYLTYLYTGTFSLHPLSTLLLHFGRTRLCDGQRRLYCVVHLRTGASTYCQIY